MATMAAVMRRMIENRNRRNAHGWAEVRDLQRALAVTSDTPIVGLNCLLNVTATDADIEQTLDMGFALLRAFDRDPAVEVTPLSRPRSVRKRLAARRLAVTQEGSWMRLREDAPPITTNPNVEVRVCQPEDARAYANTVGGSQTWMRRLAYTTAVNALQTPGNTLYLGCLAGEPVATLHLQVHRRTAAVYAVGTARAHRRKGIASTLMAAAIAHARTSGCDLICLGCERDGYAESIYVRHGFERVFTSELWTLPQTP